LGLGRLGFVDVWHDVDVLAVVVVFPCDGDLVQGADDGVGFSHFWIALLSALKTALSPSNGSERFGCVITFVMTFLTELRLSK
jgi:hypothetical protein